MIKCVILYLIYFYCISLVYCSCRRIYFYLLHIYVYMHSPHLHLLHLRYEQALLDSTLILIESVDRVRVLFTFFASASHPYNLCTHKPITTPLSPRSHY